MMNNLKKWPEQHKFIVHLVAFLLISLPSVGLYFAAEQGAFVAVYTLLGLVVLGNLLAMSIP